MNQAGRQEGRQAGVNEKKRHVFHHFSFHWISNKSNWRLSAHQVACLKKKRNPVVAFLVLGWRANTVFFQASKQFDKCNLNIKIIWNFKWSRLVLLFELYCTAKVLQISKKRTSTSRYCSIKITNFSMH